MASGAYFGTGITISYVGVLGMLGALIVWSRTWSLRQKIGGLSWVIFAFAIITIVALQQAPINITAHLMEGNYPPETEISGIKWKDNLTDMRIYVRNPTKYDYTDLNFLVQTDLVIAGIGMLDNKFGKCAFSSHSDVKPEYLTGIDEHGKRITIPFVPHPEVQDIASIYRIRCDKLIAKDEFEFVLGLVSFQWGRSNPIGPRTKPAWLIARAEYTGIGRPRTEPYETCFLINTKCGVLPQLP